MANSIEHLGALLLVAAVVAILTRKLHVPYSVGLVATGMCLALFSVEPDIRLTRDLIFSTLLPPLIFEAAMVLRWRELRPDRKSTRLNSSHSQISYAVFCLKKKKK